MEPIVLVSGATTALGKRCARHLENSGYQIRKISRGDFGGKTLRQDGLPSSFDGAGLSDLDCNHIAKYILDIWNNQGPIQALVNCHGYGLIGPLEETTPHEASRVFHANVIDIVSICHAVLPLMRMRGKGLLLNVCSAGRSEVKSFEGVYEASRCAMESLSQTLAREVRGFGIDVSLVQAPEDMAMELEPTPIAESACKRSAYGKAFEDRKAAEEKKREAPPNTEFSLSTTTLLVENLVRNACRDSETFSADSEGSFSTSANPQRAPWVLRQVQGRRTREKPKPKENKSADGDNGISPEGNSLLARVSFAGIWEEQWRSQVESAITLLEQRRPCGSSSENPKGWTCTGRLVDESRGIFAAHRHGNSGYFHAQTAPELADLIRSRARRGHHPDVRCEMPSRQHEAASRSAFQG